MGVCHSLLERLGQKLHKCNHNRTQVVYAHSKVKPVVALQLRREQELLVTLSGRGGGGDTGGGGAAIAAVAARLRSFGLINLTLPTNAVWYII